MNRLIILSTFLSDELRNLIISCKNMFKNWIILDVL